MAATAGATAVAAPPAPPVFALTPALVGGNAFLDWTKSENIKLYHKAIEKLSFTFAGKHDQVLLLLQAIDNRASECGWKQTIMTIPDANGTNRNLLAEHGLLTYDDIRNWATTDIIGQQTRKAQDNMMMFQCLYNSTSEDVKKKILLKTTKYKIGSAQIAPAFLKVLIATAEVETVATVSYVRKNLINLKVKMSELQYDINEFHHYVNQQLTTLASHGKQSEDLNIYLFESYLTVPDAEFKELIQRKRTEFHMGTINLTNEELVAFAQNCFDVRKGDTENPWLQKSLQQQEIEALTAELKASQSKFAKQLKNAKVGTKEDKSQDKKNQPRKEYRNQAKYAWKKVKPKTGEKMTKVVNSKEYRWCIDHEAWVLHSEEECKMRIARLAKEKAEAEAHNAEISDDEADDNTSPEERAMASLAAAVAIGDE